jgi:energy-coupling factor transporter ATP-binding protein EcfA2
MQKIQSITLRNFKFFYGKESEQKQNKIELNQNNLLLYGENGSGKSSIYWALYTFLQSCLKTDKQITKYFNPTDPQNLRNRFADNADDSAIVLEIVSPTGIITKEISNKKLETNKSADTTINKIIAGSDFINYKYLSKLYDFRNSEEIDLFPMFEQEVLMFIDFEESYTDNNGALSTSTLASDWWKFICVAPKTLPKNRTNINTPNQGSAEYKRYTEITIPKFISLLKQFLTNITNKSNKYLKDEFNEVFEVDFDVNSINCDYNKKLSTRTRDGKVHFPKIPLKIKFNHDKLIAAKQSIGKPHTFLNEARLTAIALAIRLAMLDERLYDVNSASLLVLDDLLLSLDMSHRDKVLDIILKKVDEYQILILTHDRAFYNLCKKRIENKLKLDNTYKWEFKEMYQDITENDIPCPFITEPKSYISSAKKYFKEFDYPASANYLRRESERILRELLPENKTISKVLDNGTQLLPLNSLINNFEAYYKDLGGDFSVFEKLKEYKDVLMNPLSHHNIEAPIYRQELVNTFEILEKLNKLKFLRYQEDINNEFPFIINETDSNGDSWEYIYYFKSEFVIMKEINGKVILNNPMCSFVSRKNITKDLASMGVNLRLKLNGGFGSIKHFLGVKTSTTFTTSKLLSAIHLNGKSILSILN